MIRFRTVGPVTVAVGAAFLSVSAARAADQYRAIRQDIEREITAGRATGVAVALVQHGRITWQQGFGSADTAHDRRVTPDTPFSLASVTKPFTTTALMELVAAGKVSLDARANDYLGAAKIHAGVVERDIVTVRQLASHSSGLPPTFQLFPVDGRLKQPSMEDVIRDYAVPVLPPGQRFLYSNVGMGIVAHIVERVSGQDLGIFLQEHVLRPLGLRQSFFDTDSSRRDEMAQRYDAAGRPFPFYVTSTPGTGELYASVHDLARFAMFHLKDHLADQQPILSDTQIDALHRPVIATLGDRSYALGWMIGHAYDGTEVVYHNGNQAGVVTVITLWPSRDAGVVVLTNHDRDDALVSRVRDAALRTVAPQWTWQTLSAPPSAPLPEGYFGKWRGTLHFRARVVPVTLSIGKRAATLQIEDRQPEPISNVGLSQGLLIGKTRGDLGLPVTRAINANGISLSLQLRASKLQGEIGAEAPVPQAESPQHLPFWAEFSKVDAGSP